MKSRILFSLALIFSSAISYAQDFEMNVWEGVKMPGVVYIDKDNNNGKVEQMELSDLLAKFPDNPNRSSGQYGKGNEGFQRVIVPTLRFYKAKTESQKPQPAIVICPGGGYAHLAYGKEGTDIANLLTANGTACFILAYRIPGNNREGALMDAQRAIRLIRKNAKKWNIDPNRIGIMGFSAGAHLSAHTSTNYNREVYAPIDDADKLSAKPDFTVLIYPAYLANKETLELSKEILVDKNTPKAFISQTQGDIHYEASSVGYALALRKAGVPVDFHYFHDAEHGYGLNEKVKPVKDWGELLKTWLKFNKLAD